MNSNAESKAHFQEKQAERLQYHADECGDGTEPQSPEALQAWLTEIAGDRQEEADRDRALGHLASLRKQRDIAAAAGNADKAARLSDEIARCRREIKQVFGY